MGNTSEPTLTPTSSNTSFEFWINLIRPNDFVEDFEGPKFEQSLGYNSQILSDIQT